MTDSAPPTMAAPTERIARGMPPDPLFDDITKAQAALIAALAKASKQFDRIGKDSKGSVAAGSAFKYADIAAINKATRAAEGALADCGVVVMQPLMPSPLGEGWSRITTIIAGHGATMSFPYDLRLSQMADGVRAPSVPQKLGAVLTYMRRYLLQSALNLAGDADLDSIPQEQGKQKQGVPPVQARPPVQRQARTRKQAAALKPFVPEKHQQPAPAVAAPVVAKPVVARPTVVTMASKPATPPDEPPHPADQEQAPDFSMREPGDTNMGQESEVTILEATQAQRDVLKKQFRRVGIKKRTELDAYISGVVPGVNAVTITDNGKHMQAVIDAISEMASAS